MRLDVPRPAALPGAGGRRRSQRRGPTGRLAARFARTSRPRRHLPAGYRWAAWRAERCAYASDLAASCLAPRRIGCAAHSLPPSRSTRRCLRGTAGDVATTHATQFVAPRMHPGDELWEFRTRPETWGRMCGSAGLVLLRRGKVVAHILTEFS